MKYRKIVCSCIKSYYAINEETGYVQMLEKRVFPLPSGMDEIEGFLLETYKESFHSTYIVNNAEKSSKKEWDEMKKQLTTYIKERI